VRVSRGADGVEIAVSDQGPGVPEDKRAEVVKRFVRLDKSRSKPGTGLGLSLVEAIMALHGGRLVLSDTRSDLDHPGLTATMVFPGLKP
jgi:signal transduction histidine kinase